jgi:predicted anti-sigma-YlaC factor YlaD
MGQDCARWRGDLGAYLLGALDGEECAAMREHLAGCAACRADYEYLLPVRSWLASTRQHLATCRACRTGFREFLHLRLISTGPQAEDRGDGRDPRGGTSQSLAEPS